MSIRIHFHGPLDRRGLPRESEVQLQPGTPIGELLRHLGYSEAQVRWMMTSVGGETRQKTETLRDGEVLDVYVLASGA